MNKIVRYGFTQAMEGLTLWVNTLSDEIVKFDIKDREKRWELYCKHVKITIEEIDENDIPKEGEEMKINFDDVKDWYLKRVKPIIEHKFLHEVDKKVLKSIVDDVFKDYDNDIMDDIVNAYVEEVDP